MVWDQVLQKTGISVTIVHNAFSYPSMSLHPPHWAFKSVLLYPSGFLLISFSRPAGPGRSPAPGEDPVPRHRRSAGSSEGARQVVRRPHLCRGVHQHGGHRDPGAPGRERNPVSTDLICVARRWLFLMESSVWSPGKQNPRFPSASARCWPSLSPPSWSSWTTALSPGTWSPSPLSNRLLLLHTLLSDCACCLVLNY